MLVADPNIFVHAALLAERVARAHGEAARNGPQPMDLGTVQGSGIGLHTMEQGKPMALALGMAKVDKVDSGFATTASSQVTLCSLARNWSVTCR